VFDALGRSLQDKGPLKNFSGRFLNASSLLSVMQNYCDSNTNAILGKGGVVVRFGILERISIRSYVFARVGTVERPFPAKKYHYQRGSRKEAQYGCSAFEPGVLESV